MYCKICKDNYIFVQMHLLIVEWYFETFFYTMIRPKDKKKSNALEKATENARNAILVE